MPSLGLRRAIRHLSAASRRTETSGSRRSLRLPQPEFPILPDRTGHQLFPHGPLPAPGTEPHLAPPRRHPLLHQQPASRTLPQIHSDKTAGITDPTKFIDVSVTDEAADADEDTDLDSDEDSAVDSDSETEAQTETETEAHLDSTTTWDPPIPKPTPRRNRHDSLCCPFMSEAAG